MKTVFLGIFAATALGTVLSLSACSSDSSSSGDAGAGTGGTTGTGGTGGACAGGPETAATPDAHCVAADGGAIKQVTGVCETSSSADAAAAGSDYGKTMQGTEADDDDCKYHVSFTVTPVCSADGATFTLTVTSTAKGEPVTRAGARIEATLADYSAIAKSTGTTTEKAGGVYEIGPVKFGHSGKWVVRFHLFQECSDDREDSPHGHAAFYVDVP